MGGHVTRQGCVVRASRMLLACAHVCLFGGPSQPKVVCGATPTGTPAVPILTSFMARRTERPTHSPPPCWSLTPCFFGCFLLGLFLFCRAMSSSIRRSPALAPASVKTAWTCVSFTPTLTPSATSCTTSRTIPERSTTYTTSTPRLVVTAGGVKGRG